MDESIQLRIGVDLLTLAQASRRIAEERLKDSDWSGMPLAVPGLDLVLEPRYKHQHMSEFRWKECYDEDGTRYPMEEKPPPPVSEFRTVNSWWSDRLQVTVLVVQKKMVAPKHSWSWRIDCLSPCAHCQRRTCGRSKPSRRLNRSSRHSSLRISSNFTF